MKTYLKKIKREDKIFFPEVIIVSGFDLNERTCLTTFLSEASNVQPSSSIRAACSISTDLGSLHSPAYAEKMQGEAEATWR